MSAVGSEYTLSDGDIPVLTNILTQVCDVWEQLATALGLPGFRIAQCRNAVLVLAMNCVIREWIAGNGVRPITLGTLKSKLESDMVGKTEFAKELITKFNKERFGAATPEAVSSEAASSASVAGGKCPGSECWLVRQVCSGIVQSSMMPCTIDLCYLGPSYLSLLLSS